MTLNLIGFIISLLGGDKMVFKRLKTLREDNGLTKSKIAEMLNISERTYSNYEVGNQTIKVSHLCTLSSYYDVPIDYIINRTDEKIRHK